MRPITIILLSFLMLLISSSMLSSEESAVNPDEELKAASEYFKNLGISKFDCDIKVVFDPSGQFKLRDIERWNIPKDKYVFIGHYHYADGGIFSLEVFGETIAKNDAESLNMQSNIIVPLIPMPGSIMTGEAVKKRYTASYKGESEFDGYPCYRIRLDANNDNEFFKYLEYYIDKKDKVIRQVDCYFDFGIWVGSGHGEFYYTKRKGMLMPNVGYGDIYLRSPYASKIQMWGKWAGYKIDMMKKEDGKTSE